MPQYCKQCGATAHPDRPNEHDPAGLATIQRYPMLQLLFMSVDELVQHPLLQERT